MKNQIIKFFGVSFVALSIFSCKSELISTESASTNADFAIAARTATDHIEGKRDSIGKGFHHKKTKIEVSALPAVITAHVAANYAGYTINHAAKHDSTGDFSVGIIKDSTHKHLLYTAAGVFVKESIKGDKGNKGKFPANAIVIADLNVGIAAYVKANYATATIHKAFKDVNNNTIIILKDAAVAKVLTFDAANAFVKAEEFTKKSKGPKKG